MTFDFPGPPASIRSRRDFSALAGNGTGDEGRGTGCVDGDPAPRPPSLVPASRSNTSFRMPATSDTREMYSSRVIGSLAARMVGSRRSRARRRPGSEPKRSEEHTSELQSRLHLVCRLLLEKKKI